MTQVALKDLYQQLAVLTQQYRTQALSQAHITQTLAFSDQLLQGLKTSPDVLCAQLSLQQTSLPPALTRSFLTCLLTGLLGLRNRINETCCQQLICAQVSMLGLQANKSSEEPSTQSSKRLSVLRKALSKAQLDSWASCLPLAQLATANQAERMFPQKQLHKVQHLVLLANQLATKMQSKGERKGSHFSLSVKWLLSRLPEYCQALLTPLLHYPTLLPPGSTVTLSNGQKALVLSVVDRQWLTRPLSNRVSTANELTLIPASTLTRAGGVQTIKGFGLFRQWWNEEWENTLSQQTEHHTATQTSFRLDAPPPVLLDIQNHLNHNDIDIAKLAQMIAQEPSLSQHLQETATATNRQKIPVTDVKHGLMMHGYERTNSLLIQQALLQRLNQNYFPLQEQFVQFTRLRAHLAGELCKENNLLVEQASCLAIFATAGLFTLGHLKGATKWHLGGERLFDSCSLVEGQPGATLQEHALKLTQAWQQPNEMVMAIRHQAKMPLDTKGKKAMRLLAACLGSSLILARQMYFAESQQTCPSSEEYLKQAFDLLNLKLEDAPAMKSRALESCHISSPVLH